MPATQTLPPTNYFDNDSSDWFAVAESRLWALSHPAEHHDDGGRYDRLSAACEILAEGVDDLDELMNEYVAAVPLADSAAAADVDRFLEWLTQQEPLNDAQLDYFEYQQAHNTIELAIVHQRLAHMRFQQLRSANRTLTGEGEDSSKAVIHLKPIRVRSRFETRTLLEQDQEAPANVMFHPVDADVRISVIEPEAAAVIECLEHRGPLRLKALTKQCRHIAAERLMDVLQELAQQGIIAFE